MSVTGSWKLTMNTPFGVQTPRLEVQDKDGAYGGVMDGASGKSELEDVAVNGNELSFSTRIDTPMGKFQIFFQGVVEGDRIVGTYKGPAGGSEFTGVRE